MAIKQKSVIKDVDAFGIIKYPLSTEKAVRLMEAENKLIFVVEPKATKAEIKQAVAKAFGAKVLAVNTTKMLDGTKKAFVKLSPETLASDITTQLGLI